MVAAMSEIVDADPKLTPQRRVVRHPAYFARVGTLMLMGDSDAPDAGATARSVIGHLRKDLRIPGEIDSPNLKEYCTRWIPMYPEATTTPGPPQGPGTHFALQLSPPIVFTIRVDLDDHSEYDASDIPTDTFAVAWDGVTAIVAWSQTGGDIPAGGGHIVARVLEEAAKLAGLNFYVQGTGVSSDDVFIHQTMRIESMPRSSKFVLAGTDDGRCLTAGLDDEYENLESMVEQLWFSLGPAAGEFAGLKNLANKITETESAIRRDLSDLLGRNYQQAAIGMAPLWARMMIRLRSRGEPKKARMLIAGLWMSIAQLSTLVSEWQQRRRNLDSLYPDAVLLFRPDYGNDVESIEALDITPISESINQVARMMGF
jgi:hypothetical protein